ncbi:MAG: hypothetical protein LDLANPLL_00156 [Turneriella sp.]|nr:hypothetical protein [Turneriella sp.]
MHRAAVRVKRPAARSKPPALSIKAAAHAAAVGKGIEPVEKPDLTFF